MKNNFLVGLRRTFFSFLTVSACILFVSSSFQTEIPNGISTREHNVMSVLWFQTAAEARALYYQAFNLARLMLDKDLAEQPTDKKRAVIVDIDETVLDNSPYEGRAIKINKGYPHDWDKWVDLAQAEALPGAVEFLQYAVSHGVDVFYVTNRKVRDKNATIENLKRKGFPQADEAHVVVRTTESSKESRRLKIAETHRIVLLMGDNLGDFAEVFDNKSVKGRNDVVDSLKSEFGKRFIVLPNPIYGDWENAIYEYQLSISDSAKNAKRKAALRGF
ncbi:MAG: 5'-nucleotidase, lipoprotein e(P4) family [Ignavibacteriae bacterium]|nr:5'-nucleotidase, lipoprotein e(P4) family [Ignavibacteriota bacterium]